MTKEFEQFGLARMCNIPAAATCEEAALLREVAHQVAWHDSVKGTARPCRLPSLAIRKRLSPKCRSIAEEGHAELFRRCPGFRCLQRQTEQGLLLLPDGARR